MLKAIEIKKETKINFLDCAKTREQEILKEFEESILISMKMGENSVCLDMCTDFKYPYLLFFSVPSLSLKNAITIMKNNGYRVSYICEFVTIKW